MHGLATELGVDRNILHEVAICEVTFRGSVCCYDVLGV